MVVMFCCWCKETRICDMLSQRSEMGKEHSMRKRIQRWRVKERSLGLFAPKACEQRGSMPRERPERTE